MTLMFFHQSTTDAFDNIITIAFTISYLDGRHKNMAPQINSPPGMQLLASNSTAPSTLSVWIRVTIYS